MSGELTRVTEVFTPTYHRVEVERKGLGVSEVGDAVISTVECFYVELREKTVYETKVFWYGHDLDLSIEEYATLEEAQRGHERWIERIREAQSRNV